MKHALVNLNTQILTLYSVELQSRNTIEGPSRAPHRAMYKATGLGDEELKRPLIGVSTTSNEATPCNIHLGKLGTIC